MSNEFEKEIKRFLGPKGPLAKILPRYQKRPEQAQMASSVLNAMDSGSILVVEAGTGTGKTLAYLVPAIYFGGRVVISTGTKALQEQLVNKDLPVLEKEFEIFSAVMKGRSNYLCWKRYKEFGQEPTFNFRKEIPFYELIQKWALETKTGDRAEIKGLPDDFSAWRQMSATGEQCIGQKCDYFDECFVTRMRAEAQQADIVVVNHHLFFADLALKDEVPHQIIPDYNTVIFDEAHSLAEVATEYFGVQVSNWRMEDLAQDVRRMERLGGVNADDLRTALRALEKMERSVNSVLQTISTYGKSYGLEGSRFSLERFKTNDVILEEGERASSDLKDLASALGNLSDDNDAAGNLPERARSLASDLRFVISQEDEDHIYWAETRGRGVTLRASPAELGPVLDQKLFSKPMPVTFTSATLAVQANNEWSFSHFKSDLGLDNQMRKVEEKWLPSSYDWKKQAILYVPNHMPDPSSSEFIVNASREMLRIIRISKGRAFLLFTSYRNLDAAYELLEPHISYSVLKQGDAPKSELLEKFRRDESSVLFATQSFWEGVDVSGQALSCVVIDKLPFSSPGDPLTSAKIERIKRKGGNPFMDFQLPSAVISLKQGLGRLIRNKEDYGILSVLDSRIHKKRYGKTFIKSLPPVPLTMKINDLDEFITKNEGK
jgi:ATP-dependent DNA helicase DinG